MKKKSKSMRDAARASKRASGKRQGSDVNDPRAVAEKDGRWDTGELGRDKKYAGRASQGLQEEVEAALALQMISLRLQKELISELKLIANYRGIGYQPLMRDVLRQYARAEMMRIAKELQEKEGAREQLESHNSRRKAQAG
jgi:uncharacterized protein (DUF4415 family)